jgi:hypothetical protein
MQANFLFSFSAHPRGLVETWSSPSIECERRSGLFLAK